MSRPIEIAGLHKRFGEVVALSDVSLTVDEGDVHGLVGPNGAGKSTLMRIVFGLVRPAAGRVTIFGQEQHPDTAYTTLDGVAGFVDRPQFYPYLTARKTLELLLAADGIDGAPTPGAVLAQVGLADAAGRKVSAWSTGMRQRLGLAAALLRRPRLLILDEPTEGLDPSGARDLLGLIRSLADDGVSVLISSHDMAEVDAICNTVTIVNRGRIERSAPLRELEALAPPGRDHLVTSDDPVALEIAGRYEVDVQRHPRSGLTLQGGAAARHHYICELGRAGISIQLLEQEVTPLTALFYSLTDEPGAAITMSDRPEPVGRRRLVSR